MSKDTGTATKAQPREKIEKEVRDQIAMEARIRAEVTAELKTKQAKKRIERTPSPEDVAVQKDIADGNVLDVIFTNHLDPGADVHFFHGGYECHFFDGQSYKGVPITVIQFVNSKMFPNDSYDVDPVTNQIKRVKKGVKPRCGLLPVNLNLKMVSDMKKLNEQTPDASPKAEG